MAGHIFPMCYSYSKFLFYSSFSMLIATIIYISVYLLLLFLTSINHWRKPEYGLRRNIDLTIVLIGIFYTLFKVCLLKDEFHRVGILILAFCSLLFFILEYVLSYLDSPKWIIFHMTLHIYVSCGAILMIFD